MPLARLAEALPAISWPQTVGCLERQHPPWIFRDKSADLIQLPKLVLGECEFDRREIVLKLVEAFRANDDRSYHRLCQEPCERETCRTTSMCFRDRSHQVEDLPGPLFVHDGKVVVSAARIVSSIGVTKSLPWIWYRSIWSVCKRRRLASIPSIMWPREAPTSFRPGPTRL